MFDIVNCSAGPCHLNYCSMRLVRQSPQANNLQGEYWVWRIVVAENSSINLPLSKWLSQEETVSQQQPP
jgi:hypothetical protein